MTDTTLIDRLKEFIESEMRPCSMDIGSITPLYMFRMWGSSFAIEENANTMEDVRRLMYNFTNSKEKIIVYDRRRT